MRPSTENINFKKSSKQDSTTFDFFLYFGAALSSGNLEIITKCWAVPSYILDERLTLSVSSTEDLEKIFTIKKKNYNERGISEVRPEILGVQWMTDQIVVANVKWLLLDKSGKKNGYETAFYTLKMDKNGKLKIHTMARLAEKIPEAAAAH